MQQRTARISTLFSNCNIFEQVVAYLMVTSVVAVVGILYLAYNGDRDVSWSEVCTFYGKFCSRAKVALVLHAYQVLLCFLGLTLISAYIGPLVLPWLNSDFSLQSFQPVSSSLCYFQRSRTTE
uniref:CASP-like protein n=1 Tax=Nelumbo nucifera TaxID=4432 RepID=A0A822YR12_NELNU|nr:TPA_asm: hypothetical protein HUJ06_005682 [Nelumbo nucifera]